MNYKTFKDWYSIQKFKVTYTGFNNLGFDFQLGAYLQYFRVHGFIISAWYTGYFLHEIDEEGNIKWLIEKDDLVPDATNKYWKQVVIETINVIAERIKQKEKPF